VAVAISEGPAPLRRPIWYQKHMARHMQDEMLGQWLDRLDHALDDRFAHAPTPKSSQRQPDRQHQWMASAAS
jgi:hypothetical protein